MQGGYYQKGFNKHGPLSNPYSFGYFPAMKHNRVPRFTHTFVIYEADALPERYRGVLFGVAPLLNHVVMSEVRPDGSSVQTHDIGLAVSTDDSWFRPVDIKLGPDGASLHRRLVRPPGQPLPQPRGADRPGRWADLPAEGAKRRSGRDARGSVAPEHGRAGQAAVRSQQVDAADGTAADRRPQGYVDRAGARSN